MPKVSFIVPCWEQWDTLPETLASIRDQTIHDYEVILVSETLKNYPDRSHLSILVVNKFLWHEKRLGLAAARTAALRIADGEFIVPLDADDTIEPNFLEKTLATYQRGTAAVVVNGTAQLTPAICKDNYLNYCALYKSSVLQQMGGWQQPSQKAQAMEDWDLWIRLWHAGWDIGSVSEKLFHWRRRDGSMSSLLEGTPLFAEIKEEMLRRNNLP